MIRKILIVVLVLFVLSITLYYGFPGVLYDLLINLERQHSGLSKQSIKIDSHTIVYLEGGKGETILLLHGFGANKDSWNQFAKYLTPLFHVLAIDLPGFGESSRIETESYSISAQASRLQEIANALRLDKFHVAGNSMGGAISGKYTVDFPDRVLTLGLFNSAGIQTCPEKSELISQLEAGKNPLLSIKTIKDLDEFLKFVFVKPPWIPRPVKEYTTREAIVRNAFNEKVFKEFVEEKYSLEPDLSKIGARTLILWGDKDRLIDVSCTKILENGLQNHTTVIMKACGHAPMVERPQEAANHYLKFLRGG